ncbi:MAG: glycosyltransferase family 4 protein [Candidatus Omnitrophica bacterium]|nr:glycosyltransferase family 4 protein [Candidatus Omnitrophota bacterium]
MNILYITNHLNIGGITSYILTLSAGLRKRGHNVLLASSGGELLSKFKDLGVVFIPIPIRTKSEISPGIALSVIKLSKIIRENKIDILHTHSRTTQVLGCFLHKFCGVKHISTCHGFFKRRLSRWIFPCWGERTIAISEQVKEYLMKDFKVKPEKINVIHNGIDLKKFQRPTIEDKQSAKRALRLDSNPTIGIVARLSDVKGHKYLIQAMGVVLGEYPRALLLIVGEGKMKDELIKLSETLGINKSVIFSPEIYDTIDVLSAMDIFVMPSLKEGLGLALMEAMACGLAVIGSDIGGIRSLIKDNFNGLLVKPRDTQALASAILGLLKNPQKSYSFAEAARNFITNNFSQEKMVLETERVYLECLNEAH